MKPIMLGAHPPPSRNLDGLKRKITRPSVINSKVLCERATDFLRSRDLAPHQFELCLPPKK
jgi:hypothetical protein